MAASPPVGSSTATVDVESLLELSGLFVLLQASMVASVKTGIDFKIFIINGYCINQRLTLSGPGIQEPQHVKHQHFSTE